MGERMDRETMASPRSFTANRLSERVLLLQSLELARGRPTLTIGRQRFVGRSVELDAVGGTAPSAVGTRHIIVVIENGIVVLWMGFVVARAAERDKLKEKFVSDIGIAEMMHDSCRGVEAAFA